MVSVDAAPVIHEVGSHPRAAGDGATAPDHTFGRSVWWAATFGLTVVVAGLLVLLGQRGESTSSGGVQTIVLFIGADVHVVATGFFYTLRPARVYFGGHPWRYWISPIGLVVTGGLLAACLPAPTLAYLLIAHGIWQWWH